MINNEKDIKDNSNNSTNKTRGISEKINNTVNDKKEQVKNKTHKITGSIRKFFTTIGIIVALIVCVCIASLFSYLKGKADGTNEEPPTHVHLEEKLEAIGELSTYSFEYTNEFKDADPRKLFGFEIPGTNNEIEIIYSGVVKVGYEISDIECKINESKKIIFVTIPKVQVFDNYIKLDDLQCKERNNIFNPIGTEQIVNCFDKIEEYELKRAEDAGIYDKAEEQLKTIIQTLFEDFKGYDVVFTN